MRILKGVTFGMMQAGEHIYYIAGNSKIKRLDVKEVKKTNKGIHITYYFVPKNRAEEIKKADYVSDEQKKKLPTRTIFIAAESFNAKMIMTATYPPIMMATEEKVLKNFMSGFKAD